MNALLTAALFAADRHSEGRRKDKASSPYINHVLAVAEVLARYGIDDMVTLQAAVLHDTIEDTKTSADELESAFGAEVCAVVLEVSDDKSLDKAERKRLQIVKSPQLSNPAKLIKLADMISNVSDVATSPPVNWSLSRRVEYLEWSEQVVRGCRGTHGGLEEHYDTILGEARDILEQGDQKEEQT